MTASLYFLAQGSLGLLWWAVVLAWPATRSAFLPPTLTGAALFALLVPDLLVFVGGSLATGALAARRHGLARPAAFVTLGGTSYATLYSTTATLYGGGGWWGPAFMVAATLGTVWATGRAGRDP